MYLPGECYIIRIRYGVKTVWIELSESMWAELEENRGRGEDVRSESEMREDWR